MLRLAVATAALFVTSALAHGVVTSPAPRAPGPELTAVCGSGPATLLTNDLTAPVEEAVAKAGSDTTDACNLFFCRGLQFADNTDLVQTFPAGTVVDFAVNLKVLHTGWANVSIVDTNTQTVIGDQLFNWPVYADSTVKPPPADETSFSVTIPDLEGACSTPGDCAVQWWWFGSAVDQTYMSCVDFVQ